MRDQPLRKTKYTTKPHWFTWLCFVLGLAAMVATLVYGYFDSVLELINHGTARATSSAFFYVVILFLLLLVTLGLMLVLLNQEKVTVELNQERLLIIRKKSKWEIPYNGIDELYRIDKTTYLFLLPMRTGKLEIHTQQGIATLSSKIRKFDRMLSEIESAVFPLIHSRMISDLKIGLSIKFKEISVHNAGLTHGDQQIAWKDVSNATVKAGKFILDVVHPSGVKQVIIPAGSIPNLPLLLDFIEKYKS